MSTKNFYRQLKLSKAAVEELARYYRDAGISVADTQNDPKYRDKDIDLIIKGKPKKFVEVKCDFKMEELMQRIEDKTSQNIKDNLNLYIEDISCLETGSKGWLKKSEADDIYYVHYRKGHLNPCHIFDLSELREWIKNNNPRITTHPDDADGKTKQAYLIPIAQIERLKSYRRINLPAFVA